MNARSPASIQLARPGPPVLALGAWLKAAVCATRGDEAFLSASVGDLGEPSAVLALEETARQLLGMLDLEPAAVAHDLHPDFHSTRFAHQLAAEFGVPAIGVQHHHAHIAAVVAEHGMEEPVLGLALDGVGLGTDGGAWGGELLRVGQGEFARLGHLRTLPMPGGDRAAREPWRMAAAVLHELGRVDEVRRRFPRRAAQPVVQMLASRLRCPPTSSAGRWFDAAAALLGVCETNEHEGEAPMRLEALAAQHGPAAPLDGGWCVRAGNTLDLLPLLDWLADCVDPSKGAAIFHATLAAALAEWALNAASEADLACIALGGGCFANRVLSAQLRRLLAREGLQVLQARLASPGDAGLALGQAAVAIPRLRG